MADSKSSLKRSGGKRSTTPTGSLPPSVPPAAAARIEALEGELNRVRADVALLRAETVELRFALDALRVKPLDAARRKVPPPLPAIETDDVIAVDEREVTLESIRPRKPRA